ncbi:MAG: SDR family oxidoreductase [Rhodovibrionaceae bacterium]
MNGAAPLAVLIGGGNGIGEATARLMQARGWRTAVADRDGDAAARVAEDLGGSGYNVDITEEASLQQLSERIEKELGPVDALVVAAAMFQDIVPSEELETEVWERILRTNLTGTFLANRIFGKAMLARRRGSIVNIASIAALGSMPAEAYGTSKAGVVHLTKNLAGEWGRSGIRVNCVSPGSTLVPRVAERLKTKRYAADPGDFTALGRIVQPSEVAEAIEFLASERASAITGVNLVVDAGWQVASTWSQFGGVRPAPGEGE